MSKDTISTADAAASEPQDDTMTLREAIQEAITGAAGDDAKAAITVCELLEDEGFGLYGNGWFDDDPVMAVSFAHRAAKQAVPLDHATTAALIEEFFSGLDEPSAATADAAPLVTGGEAPLSERNGASQRTTEAVMSKDDFWNAAAKALAADLRAKPDALLLHFLRTTSLDEVASLAGGAFSTTTENTRSSIRATLAAQLACRLNAAKPSMSAIFAEWLRYRLSTITARTVVPWPALKAQFGQRYPNDEPGLRDFKWWVSSKLLKSEAVIAVSASWNVTPTCDGLVLNIAFPHEDFVNLAEFDAALTAIKAEAASIEGGSYHISAQAPAGWTHAETSTPGGSGNSDGE